jgi:hypothetical protein
MRMILLLVAIMCMVGCDHDDDDQYYSNYTWGDNKTSEFMVTDEVTGRVVGKFTLRQDRVWTERNSTNNYDVGVDVPGSSNLSMTFTNFTNVPISFEYYSRGTNWSRNGFMDNALPGTTSIGIMSRDFAAIEWADVYKTSVIYYTISSNG